MSVIPHAPTSRKRKLGEDSDSDVTNSKRLKGSNPIHVRASAKLISGIEENVSTSQLCYNQIAHLIQYAKAQEAQGFSQAATLALCRIFSRFFAAGVLSTTRCPTNEDGIISQWLRGRYYEFIEFLFNSIATANHEGQRLAVNTLMHLAREDSLCSIVNLVNRKTVIFRLLETFITRNSYHNIRREFLQKFVDSYDDLQAYTFDALSYGFPFFSNNLDLQSSRKITSLKVGQDQMDAVIEILLSISATSKTKERSASLYFRAYFTKDFNTYWTKARTKHAKTAWINVFNHPLSNAQRKLLLSALVPKISPWIPQIELLIDFLTDSFNIEGSTSLLALSGLFYLMLEKNLEYPRFFEKMYSILDHIILHSKHRSRFFRLLVKCLESTHLPVALAASFIKRLSQIALQSAPSGTIIVIPLIYNLLNNHPSLTFMIHRIDSGSGRGCGDAENVSHEPFLAHTRDPMKTCAEQSSIWEIKSLQSHYHPSVAMLARIISEPFFKRAYSMEDFLDHSYETVTLRARLVNVCID